VSAPPVTVRPLAGLRASVAVAGEGQPVLALHGWGGSAESFWPVAERLAPLGYQVHVPDLPGFGESEAPPQPWGVADYVAFVLAYLDAAALARVAVLGHSFGGRIAMMLAADHPARVSKLALANSAGLRTPPTAAQQARRVVAHAARETLNAVGLRGLRARVQASYNARYGSDDYRNAGPLRATFLRVIAEDIAPYAARVQAPTLLIWGDQDQDTPLWQGRRLEQLIPDAGLVVFQGAGHFSYLDRLNDYLRIVHHFLSSRG